MSEDTPVDKKDLSQAPSWVIVGFVAGILVMLGFRGGDEEPEAAPPPPAPEPTAHEIMAEEPQVTSESDAPSLEIVEALFSAHQEFAFWNEDRTEIAVWNSHTLSFSDHFEVVRHDDGWYFRPILRFTRLPIEGYGPPNSPILFTETAEERNKRIYAARGEKPPEPELPAPVRLNRLPRSPGD